MVHVPYKGSGASLKDAVSGQVKIMFGNVISAGPFVASGALRGLAVTSLVRSPMFPDVPTAAESVFPISTSRIPTASSGRQHARRCGQADPRRLPRGDADPGDATAPQAAWDHAELLGPWNTGLSWKPR